MLIVSVTVSGTAEDHRPFCVSFPRQTTAMDASRLELKELLAGLSQEEALSHIKALKAYLRGPS